MNTVCPFCSERVDPTDQYSWQRMVGWQRIAGTRPSGKQGGSDIALRETRQEWAHAHCVRLAKSGLLHQEALL
jgi:hypothetical protein